MTAVNCMMQNSKVEGDILVVSDPERVYACAVGPIGPTKQFLIEMLSCTTFIICYLVEGLLGIKDAF